MSALLMVLFEFSGTINHLNDQWTNAAEMQSQHSAGLNRFRPGIQWDSQIIVRAPKVSGVKKRALCLQSDDVIKIYSGVSSGSSTAIVTMMDTASTQRDIQWQVQTDLAPLIISMRIILPSQLILLPFRLHFCCHSALVHCDEHSMLSADDFLLAVGVNMLIYCFVLFLPAKVIVHSDQDDECQELHCQAIHGHYRLISEPGSAGRHDHEGKPSLATLNLIPGHWSARWSRPRTASATQNREPADTSKKFKTCQTSSMICIFAKSHTSFWLD